MRAKEGIRRGKWRDLVFRLLGFIITVSLFDHVLLP